MLAEKELRIPAGAADGDHRIENEMIGLGEERRQEGALARLPGARNQWNREVFSEPGYFSLNVAFSTVHTR